MPPDSYFDLQYDVEGEALVYGLLILEALQHGDHKISRERVAIIVIACSSPSF